MKDSKLSRDIFWDIDYNNLDYEKNARFIIERVLNKGDLPDWYAIKKIYGLKRIKNEVIHIRNLDNKTLNLLSIIFNIPKEKFRCYTTKQFTRKLWNY